MELLTTPEAGLGPVRAGLREGVNTRYAGAADTLATKMLSHGGARSGKFGTAMRRTEMARLGELGGVDSTIAQMMLDQRRQGAELGQNLLSIPFETSVDSTGTTTSKGTTVLPGSGVAGGIVGGLQGLNQSLITYLALQQMLGGGQAGYTPAQVIGPGGLR